MKEIPNSPWSNTKRELFEKMFSVQFRESTIPRGKEHSSCPVSFAQEQLWFLYKMDPASVAYNVPFMLTLKGNVNVEILRKCFDELVNRHESLRTVFAEEKGKPVQVVLPPFSMSLPVEDLSNDAKAEQKAMEMARKEAKQPFDLTQGPLMRMKLFCLKQHEYLLFLNIHHIIFDGWSITVLIEELDQLYKAFERGEPSPLEELPIKYGDYSQWQKERLEAGHVNVQLHYWKNRLKGDLSPIHLPLDRPRPARQTFRGGTERIELPLTLVERLRKLGQKEDSTLFITLLAAFQALLHRYTGQLDLVVGTPVSNRPRKELEGMIGFFANSLVIRSDLSGNPSFRELLSRVRSDVWEAFENQDVPFERLVKHLQPERDMSMNPLFQVAFALHHLPMGLKSGTVLTVDHQEVPNDSAKMDLEVALYEKEAGITGKFEYNADLFHSETISRMVRHFQNLLEQCVNHPDQPINSLPMLTNEEQKRMLVDWNQTNSAYPEDIPFPDLFEAIVQKEPQRTAVVYQSRQISYRELNERSNRLAHYLKSKGVGAESLVGICMERSPETLIGILGVMKAGGAYLPLDPNYPAERLKYMLEDAQVPLLLTQEKNQEKLPLSEAVLICLDRDWLQIAVHSPDNPDRTLLASHLAYVIYTSGSTGKPKGVMLEHRGLCNLIHAQIDFLKLAPESRVFQFASLSFDASVFEIFSTWVAGGTLCMVPQTDIQPGLHMTRVLKSLKVTHVTLPPTVLSLLDETELSDLQVVVSAGSACSEELARRWSRGRTFINAYGPTEFTVCATYHEYNDPSRLPTIGKPIANTRIYVLDNFGNPVPQGVVGELYLGGDSLARGYLNRPELTKERFIPDPFYPKGGRLYRTGDLVRYLSNGELEFIGRVDDQVKVRGFRIEPGEIEFVLCGHPDIREAVVQAVGDEGNRYLVAYVVLRNGATVTEKSVYRYLEEKLPQYMVPSQIVFLDQLPLTSNGKVDRKALPQPEGMPLHGDGAKRPRNDTEAKIANIWIEMLQTEQVGIHDPFFQIGGHSLMGSQVLARIREEFQVEIPIHILFEKPTIAELSEEVERRQAQLAQAGEDVLSQQETKGELFSIKNLSRDRYRSGKL